ncbi:transcription termination protein NusB [Liquorilactobacillus sucicola DSM 21376 = JCM 15457]|uniref:Transcription antitermination protein NusB n=1 Tax=Liquorilactobacillus sucicola DSM 21376 = JCM 15457 TaxID=1423806 RepID=A0A023CU92_9LACO|nr:transcription antitermination factor NusB [Liquorilactobacillus sucicola]KRN05352.1 transcription antitermination protein NusB [Liquorilactobacillus sucicola DSM 21376 = JCM 15457]GAJ25422.1 transcription termination protein NusB [Liquorilactobacillus sucicola DSM 21376 = JCM 15457]
MTRHTIRRVVFQILFALESNSETNIKELYTEIQSEDETRVDSEMPSYLETLVNGVSTQKEELDQVIASHLSNKWSISRLNKTDLLILRIAIYEAKFADGVPARVAINEALQLSKEFSDEKSRRFINGVLSNLVTETNNDAEQSN